MKKQLKICVLVDVDEYEGSVDVNSIMIDGVYYTDVVVESVEVVEKQ